MGYPKITIDNPNITIGCPKTTIGLISKNYHRLPNKRKLPSATQKVTIGYFANENYHWLPPKIPSVYLRNKNNHRLPKLFMSNSTKFNIIRNIKNSTLSGAKVYPETDNSFLAAKERRRPYYITNYRID